MINKEAFLIYKSFYEPIKTLKTEHKGLLLTAIFEYQINGKEIDLPPEVKMAFLFIKTQLDVDNKKYEKTCEKNRQNGVKGGRPKEEPKKTTGLIENPKNQNAPDNENENDNDLNNTILNCTDTITNLDYLKKEKINKKEKSENISSVEKYGMDKKTQVHITENFEVDYSDPYFEPYHRADFKLRKQIDTWLKETKKDGVIDKTWIAKQITTFAKRHNKIEQLMGV